MWTYAWTLIPGFVGLGLVVVGLLRGRLREGLNIGGMLIIISLVMFATFGSIFGGVGEFLTYWPILLVLIGIWILFRTLFKR